MVLLMNNYKLFNELQVKLAQEIYNKYDKVINKVAKLHKISKQAILDKIARIILEYNVIDGVISINTAIKAKLRKQLNEFIKEVFKTEYKDENAIINDTLYDVAKDKYYSNCYLYSIGVNYTLKPVKENILKKIISKKIKGKNYSDRIWSNKNKVAKQIRIEVDKFLNGKTDINSISGIISKKFDVNWNNSNRLVRTEITKVQTQANEYWSKEHGIKKQLFSATLDGKTSKICQSLDGKVFNYDDSNKPIPPLHPNCRSCLIDMVEGWKPTERLDNENKQRISYKTYKEWLGEQDIN